MSEHSDYIRKWLLRNPRPDSVTVNLRDGDSQTIELKGSIRWRDVAETIEALDPESLHALSGGQLLRAERFGPVAAVAEKEAPASLANVIPGLPALPVELAGDKSAVMLAYFAALLDRSYQFGISTANALTTNYIDLMNRRNEVIEQRLERTERNLQRTMEDRYEDAWEQLQAQIEASESRGEGSDVKENLIAAFMQGQALQNAAAPAAKPNGKGKPS